MKMDTAELVVFGRFISVLILSFGLQCVTSSRDLALHRTATQSSTYNDGPHYYNARRAVDGVLGRDIAGGHCSHTGAGHNKAWWKVDLGDVYRIQTINITYRHDYTHRLYGYYLYVTNHTEMAVNSNDNINSSLGHLCYHDNGSALPNYFQSRPCPIKGRYVIFYNQRPIVNTAHPSTISDEAYIELCEVQVFECDSNTFGRDCRETCHCTNSGCDRVSGICTIPGCTDGWTGDSCSHACVAGRFGKDCLQECHCKEEGCDNVDGTCDAKGCVEGWRGTSCNHTCDFTHYGPNCLYECHCNVSGCSNINGLCQRPGCKDGWTGPSCSDAAEQKSSKSDYPQIAEVSTCTTGYALLGTFLAISISFNIGLTIQRVRMRYSNSRSQSPSKELQTYHIPNQENSYEGLDSTKIDKTRNIYDTIIQ